MMWIMSISLIKWIVGMIEWELDPASSEGYEMRINHEGEYEGK